ncbi:MAG: hypothetical protein ACI3XQ_11000, partial [Eubacteriales bacterium]
YPQKGIQNTQTRLRIQTDSVIDGQSFRVIFNGYELVPDTDISEPFGVQYPPLLGNENTLRAFTLPVDRIADGENRFEITLLTGEPIRLIAVDIALI